LGQANRRNRALPVDGCILVDLRRNAGRNRGRKPAPVSAGLDTKSAV